MEAKVSHIAGAGMAGGGLSFCLRLGALPFAIARMVWEYPVRYAIHQSAKRSDRRVDHALHGDRLFRSTVDQTRIGQVFKRRLVSARVLRPRNRAHHCFPQFIVTGFYLLPVLVCHYALNPSLSA